MDNIEKDVGAFRELSICTGAGGGLLGSEILGFRTVCAIEIEPYCAGILCERQNEGSLPLFPIWDNVKTFDGRHWRGHADLITAGFPCQDISSCNKYRTGIFGTKSSLFFDICRILPGLDSTLCLENWPRWGTMRNGECYLRPPLEHPICEKGSGGYLDCIPTPVARSSFYERNQSQMNRNSPGYGVLLGGRPNPDWIEWLMGWPIGWTALKPLEMDKSLAVWRRLFCNYHLDSLERGSDDTSTFDLDDVSRDINAREYGKTARKRRESDMKQRTLFE